MSKTQDHSRRIELAARTSLRDAARRLRQIVDGLEAGSLTLQHCQDRLVMAPGEDVELRFRAKQKRRSERLAIELHWRRAVTADGLGALEIGESTNGDADKRAQPGIAARPERVRSRRPQSRKAARKL